MNSLSGPDFASHRILCFMLLSVMQSVIICSGIQALRNKNFFSLLWCSLQYRACTWLLYLYSCWSQTSDIWPGIQLWKAGSCDDILSQLLQALICPCQDFRGHCSTFEELTLMSSHTWPNLGRPFQIAHQTKSNWHHQHNIATPMYY